MATPRWNGLPSPDEPTSRPSSSARMRRGKRAMSPRSWLATITVVPSGQGAVTIAPSGTFAATDVAGNQTTTAGGTDRSVTYDTVAPDVALKQAPAQTDPANANPIQFVLVATESLDAATVTTADFTATGGTIGTISCAADTCTIPVTEIGRAHV